jgi:hypothetical protein
MPGPIGYPFLATAPAKPKTRFEPLLRSSLAHRHRGLVARFEERDGWLVPVAYPAEAENAPVSLADVSHVGKLEVFAETEPTDDAIVASLAVGPGRYVLLCRYADTHGLAQRLDAAPAFVIDRTSAWCALVVTGPDRNRLFRRVSSTKSVPGRGPLGKVPSTILERRSGYWFLFSQEFAQYAWDLFVDAAAPLGGGPVGVDAIADEPLLTATATVDV